VRAVLPTRRHEVKQVVLDGPKAAI
jgi:hypothetical protein